MSERRKLEDEFLYNQRRTFTMADFIIAYGKLVENCKHEKTHWLQEMTREGDLSRDLVKRCFVCGCNIDILDVDVGFKEELMKRFDEACEEKKREQK